MIRLGLMGCGVVASYYMLVSVCNELGVSINMAARKLEAEVKRGSAGWPGLR